MCRSMAVRAVWRAVAVMGCKSIDLRYMDICPGHSADSREDRVLASRNKSSARDRPALSSGKRSAIPTVSEGTAYEETDP